MNETDTSVDSLDNIISLTLSDAGIVNFNSIESIRFVQLSWQPAVNLTFEYEVVYIIDSDCSLNHTILPDDGYTVYYNTTTSTCIEVFGLIPDTCYVFGVTACPDTSNLTIINGVTVMESNVNILFNKIIFVFCLLLSSCCKYFITSVHHICSVVMEYISINFN